MKQQTKRKTKRDVPEEKVRELDALYQISSALSYVPDFEGVMHQLMERAAELLGAQACTPMYYYPERRELAAYLIPAFGYGLNHAHMLRIGIDEESFTARVFRTGEPLLSNDAKNDPRILRRYVELFDIQSLLTVPLKLRDRTVGVFHFINKEGGFSEEDVKLFSLIAPQAAAIMENVRLYTLQEARTEELEALLEIGEAVGSTLELDEVMNTIVRYLTQIVSAEQGAVFILDETEEILTPIAHFGIPEEALPTFHRSMPLRVSDVPLAAQCLRERKPVAIDDVPASGLIPPAILEDAGIQSLLAVPLVSRGKVIGSIHLVHTKPYHFTEDEIRIAAVLARQAVIAIENARLYEMTGAKLMRRMEELAVLSESARRLTAIVTPAQLMPQILAELERVIDFPQAGLYLYDEAENSFTLVATKGLTREEIVEAKTSAAERHPGWVVTNKQPLLVGDAELDPRVKYFGKRRNRSLLYAPIVYEEHCLGAIGLGSPAKDAFTEDDLRLVTAFADQAAVAIENARLFAERERKIAELAALNQIGQALSATLEFDQLLSLIHKQTGRVMDAINFYIALYDEAEDEIHFEFDVEEGKQREKTQRKMGAGLTEHLIRTGKPLLFEKDVAENCRRLGIEPVGRPARSWLGVPMLVGDQVIGAMAVQSYHKEGAYDHDHLELLSTIASQAAVAIENARLYEEGQRRVREAETLLQATQTMASGLNLEEVLETLSQQLAAFFQADKVLFAFLQEGRGLVTAGVGVSPDEVRSLQAGYKHIAAMPAAQKILAQALPIIIEDVDVPHRQPTLMRRIFPTAKAALMVPVISKETVSGVVGLVWHHPRRFVPAEIALATAIANQAAVAIENARLHEEQRRVDRLAAMGRMTAVVAHEMRNPLAGVMAGIDYLAQGLEAGSEWATATSLIREECERLNRVIEDMLLVTRPPQLRLTSCDLIRVVAGVIERHQDRFIAQKISIKGDWAADLPHLQADVMRIEQALSNVVRNSIEAMPEGGTLTLAMHCLEGAGEEADWVEIQISDTGAGIPAEVLPHIFEPFFTTKPHGTGLGLPIVQNIIEEHGGVIAVESVPEVGTTFVIRLPTPHTRRNEP